MGSGGSATLSSIHATTLTVCNGMGLRGASGSEQTKAKLRTEHDVPAEEKPKLRHARARKPRGSTRPALLWSRIMLPMQERGAGLAEFGPLGRQPGLMSMLRAAFIASGFFGIVTVSTPLLKLASILSRSTPSGTRKERSKEPYRRSDR